jgi:4-amino-4-deoxy-L-arabinose transferase-like glycosyltransferase
MNPRWKRYIDPLILLTLAVISYFLFCYKLGGIGMVGPDEPRYAAIARTMLQSGDYITPRLNGETWFEKPVLYYWLGALGYKIFGFSERGARFPSALAATLTIFLVYWFAKKLWDRTTGLLAAVMLATSVGFFSFARAASMDMPLTACLTAALVFFLVGYKESGPRRRWWFYLSYASMGLGALAKGPVAFFLPALSLFGFLAVRRSWEEWRTWHPEGLAIGLAVALPWYIACTVANGYEFIQVFIINHNLERFATTMHGHEHPFYFYFPVLLLLTFPWTFLLIPAFRRPFTDIEQLLLWWSVVPFVFFSISGSKLPGYILPIVPALTLLCAPELRAGRSRAFKVAVFIEAGTMAFIGVGFGFFNTMIKIDPHVSGMLIAVIALSLAVILSVVAIWFSPVVLVVVNASAMLAMVIVATVLVFPRFDVSDTMRPWAHAIEEIVPSNQTVLLYKPTRNMEYGLEFYRDNHARTVGSPQELSNAIADHSRAFCIAEDRELDELARLGNVDMEVVHTIGDRSAFWVWLAR